MTTRIGLGTILGQLRNLPFEIIARIKEEANLTKRLERLRTTVNLWIEDEKTWMISASLQDYPRLFDRADFLSWMREFAEGVLNVRRQENRIRRLRE